MVPRWPGRVVVAGTAGAAAAGAGAVSWTWAARGSWSSSLRPLPERRLRRRRDGPEVRSGFAAAAGGAATGGGSGRTPPLARGRRLPRRLGAATPAAAGDAGLGSATGWRDLRLTLAPTSPSAQSAPSAEWTSTRQTTIEDGAPATGGRFWVRVQRA